MVSKSKIIILLSLSKVGMWKSNQELVLSSRTAHLSFFLMTIKWLIYDVVPHLHKNDVTDLKKKIGDKVFRFSKLQSIDFSKETKMIMKFPQEWHIIWPRAIIRGNIYNDACNLTLSEHLKRMLVMSYFSSKVLRVVCISILSLKEIQSEGRALSVLIWATFNEALLI